LPSVALRRLRKPEKSRRSVTHSYAAPDKFMSGEIRAPGHRIALSILVGIELS